MRRGALSWHLETANAVCKRRNLASRTQLAPCEGSGDVVGVLTLLVGGVAQTCHDDRVVELKEQLVVEEVDGEGQGEKVEVEREKRVKEGAPWMVWRWL